MSQDLVKAPILAKKGTFPATVVKILDDYKIAINRGQNHALRLGQIMLVYRLSDEEIIDTNTGKSLGHLEIVVGTGRIIDIQENLSIIESDNGYQSSGFLPIALLDAARAIKDKSDRTRVLATHLPEVLPAALDAARAIKDESDRAKALAGLAAYLPEVLPEALDAARAIKDESDRAKVLASLAAHLPFDNPKVGDKVKLI